MERYLADLRISLRIFRRSPTLALSAVVALAMGIGLTTTMFSIVRGGTRPLPFEHPEQLVALTRTSPMRGNDIDPGRFDFVAWSRQQRTFAGIAAFEEQSVNLGDDARRPERRSGTAVTPGTFGLLRVRPMLGRLLDSSDVRADAPAVVLVSHDLWRERFASDSAVVGRDIRINGTLRRVVGVMPPRFGFPVRSSLWLPLAVEATPAPTALGAGTRVFGRLKDGVGLEQARADLARIANGLAQDYPTTHASLSARAFPFVELEMAPNTPAILYLMLGCVSFVLLIACANVANLLLARAATRSREFAVRSALGATRGRLVALHVSESIALAAVGGAIGLWIAHLAVPAFAIATSDIISAFWIDFRVDAAVTLFATITVAVAGIVAGLVPGLRASRASIAEVLKDSSATATGAHTSRLTRMLVLAEVTLATGLLIMTMTFTRTAVALRAIDLPFDARGIFTAQLGLTQDALNDVDGRERLARELAARLDQTPGVAASGLASVLPGRGAFGQVFSLDAPPVDRGPASRVTTGVVMVTPGFFDVLGATARSGRLIAWSDRPGAPEVAVVNESWVRTHSADRNPIGRRIWLRDRPLEIVGVVADLQMQDPEDRDGAGIYASMLQIRPYAIRVLARTSADATTLTRVVQDAAESIDPDLPVFEAATLYDAIYSEKKVLDAFATIFFAAGVGALFLTMLGVYGIVSFSVTSRTREIGVRVALGASRADVVRLVARQGATLIGAGVLFGLVLAFGLSHALAAATEFVQPAEPPTYMFIATALIVTAAIGLVRPVWRAVSLNPVDALREW